LEEITDADLLLHVVDVTHHNAHAQSRAVFHTLEEIQADHIPVISALNKIDLLEDSDGARRALEDFPNAVAISALTGEGVNDLLKSINELLFENYVQVSLWLPYKEGGLISLFHEQGKVEMVEHGEEGIKIKGLLPNRLVARFSPYIR
jgi:GTP-binding protein HflX